MSITVNSTTGELQSLESKTDLIKRLFCKNCSDDELQLFMHACKRTGLDPFMKQIYAIKRGNVMTIQTGIDGFRLIAERGGNYSPGRESTFTYGNNKEVLSATSYIKKRTSDNTWHEVAATAYMEEYNPKQGLWSKMPRTMLAKCAEALALRKAFPAELSGLYTQEEMSQADSKESSAQNIDTLATEKQFAILDTLIMQVEDIDPEYIEKVRSIIGVQSFYDMNDKQAARAIKSLEKRLSATKGVLHESASVA
jgi:phage recombination protein Bet